MSRKRTRIEKATRSITRLQRLYGRASGQVEAKTDHGRGEDEASPRTRHREHVTGSKFRREKASVFWAGGSSNFWMCPIEAVSL